jgi:hypothetical protein
MRAQAKSKFLAGASALLCVLGLASQAGAHATSIGYENAGPGAVTIWLGTYQHGGHHNEGSMKLEGALGTVYGPTTLAFNLLTGDGIAYKPAGLIDGTTNWYVQGTTEGNNLPLVPTEAQWLAFLPGYPTNHWQGVTFSGLSAGDYKFTWVPAINPTQEWSPWSTSMNGIFHLGESVVNPGNTVPEPTSIALVSLGLAGMARFRKRRIC